MSVASVPEEAEFQRLVGYVLGNQAAWIASIGVQTGMFRTIAEAGENGIREGALAEQWGYTARYVEVWCRAAYAFELLEWDELSGYRMTPRMATLLLDSSDPPPAGRLLMQTATGRSGAWAPAAGMLDQ